MAVLSGSLGLHVTVSFYITYLHSKSFIRLAMGRGGQILCV